MTTMAPAGEGGGGAGTGTGDTRSGDAERPPSPSASAPAPAQQHQHPPPSPLSGCYLLVVLPEPHTAQHKDLILNRLAKGFLSWDKDSCHVDLEKEIQALVAQAPEGEEARNGERLIQYATENLVTEVLIYPQINTLLQCIRNLLASFTKHRHIIHAGYTFGGNGSWILQDGTFSLADFLDAFSEHEVQRVLRAYENSVTVDIHCAGVGDWSTSRLSKEFCTRACRVRVNPDDVLTAGVPVITSFTNYIGQYLVSQTLDELMEPSDVVGNIRFSHPTLYVFPGGQGDAALFGINGFNMLVDGGFARKACFWDFARHLDRLDAVLVTRINNSNIGGMSSVLRKKKEMHVYPQIGHFFCNLVERRHFNSPDGDKDIDPLILDLIDIGQEMMVNLRQINLRPHPCYRDLEPINLYHKVGHGTLDMYVLSPSKDSREVRDFLAKWTASDSKLFAGSHRKDLNSITFPVQNLVSICALLVWQPANPEDTITRILFPGSTPQHKIFEGFERLKHLQFLKHPTCTAKSISPSTSLLTLKDKTAILKPKLGSIERETKRPEIRREKKDLTENKAVKKDSVVDDTVPKISAGKPIISMQSKTESKIKKVVENKKIESEAKENRKTEKELKETKKEIKKIEKSERSEVETKKTDGVKVENEKTALIKEPKIQKIEPKKKETKESAKPIAKSSKSEATVKPSLKPIEKKSKPSVEKKDLIKSSPTTPKKSMNGAATKNEISKSVAKTTSKMNSKITSAAPAKSAKEANNRMVVEQKNIELSSMSGSTVLIAGGKGHVKSKTERKPISRRTKPVSPSKARLPISPAKSTRSTPTASVKSDKDSVVRKVKGGTTDSSAVSTPSGIEPDSAIKLVDKNLTEKSEDMSLDSIESKVLADLKEEREVVEEIEAVLQKAERIEARKEERFEGDDEITAEAVDKKEEDMTEEDVTAEMDDVPKKISRKESQELTEEDEYLIIEKEEVYTEDSIQSGDIEQKHHLDEVESEKIRTNIQITPQAAEFEHDEDRDFADEKKDEVPEKKLVDSSIDKTARGSMDLSPEHKELLKEEMKQIIASATEAVHKTEEKDDSGKRDSEDITKAPSSLSPDKLDSSVKPENDQKEMIHEKLEESQERISTLESGATTTAPTLPEDERIPLDEIKEDINEKHVVEEVKEKDNSNKQKEIIFETLSTASKPDVKVLDVRLPVHHGVHRDVVKTPDEVADLPVHEEVDPKLYRVDDIEKYKDTKIATTFHEIKEPLTAPAIISPPVKEQKDKGVFSFFGKVADKFEKGIDKLTKKARRDSDKDAEDKSSKSSSPKEPKISEKLVLEDVDIDKVFPKVGKLEEKQDFFEEAKPQVSDIKVAAIKETATFLHEEVKESKVEQIEQLDVSQSLNAKIEGENMDDELKHEAIEDIEEVKVLVEEASKKFKNVKDSLQDSLESLEDKLDEINKLTDISKDIVKDNLTSVAEKLTDIQSIQDNFLDSKQPEKVKFIIPRTEEIEEDEDYSDGITRDFKEAVRDVAEVLAGTAGIEIEKEDKDKPKDVEKIVKKVAQVLKEDEFLLEKTLFLDKKDNTSKQYPGDSAKVEEFLQDQAATIVPVQYGKDDKLEIQEETCTQKIKETDTSLLSPVRDKESDRADVFKLCEDIMNEDIIEKPIMEIKTDSKMDVVDLGLEEVCIKKIAKKDIQDDSLQGEKESELENDDKIILESEISFDQKISPGTAELVTVTPGSTPTSPKLTTESELSKLPIEYIDILNKEMNLESIIEEFIILKKYKITIQVLEYITVSKCVPRTKVISIIREISMKNKIPLEAVTDNVQILRTYDISIEKRVDIENMIVDEYLNKNQKINFATIKEISAKKAVPKSILIQIIEEIIIEKQKLKESVFDISEESYISIFNEVSEDEAEPNKVKQEHLLDLSDTASTQMKDDEETKIDFTSIQDIVDDKLVDGFVSISSKAAVEAFLQHERKKSHGEMKIVDDFEAVEQEYKVCAIPLSTSTVQHKESEDVSEDMNDVIEADEKFVKETIDKGFKEKLIFETEMKETSELSEIDTNEKYLDEAKEKIFEVPESLKDEDEAKLDHLKKSPRKISSALLEDQTNFADATGYADFMQTDKASSVQQEIIDRNTTLQDEVHENQDGVVKRMVVTASSEDGGHETEICPSGTIIFNKITTQEDSLKYIDIKTTPEVDSSTDDKGTVQEIEKHVVSDETVTKNEGVIRKDNILEIDDPDPILFSSEVDATAPTSTRTESRETSDSFNSGGALPAGSVFSKSPTEKVSEEKTSQKEHSLEKLIVFDDKKEREDKRLESDAEHKSKSPSVEKEVSKEQSSSDKLLVPDDGKESSCVEKEVYREKLLLEKQIVIDDVKEEAEKIQTDTEQKSKSSSIEKEVCKKGSSPVKSLDLEHSEEDSDVHLKNEALRSKSPSMEKDVCEKESSLEKLIASGDDKIGITEQAKSGVELSSKSPSLEKELRNKESSPEKSIVFDDGSERKDEELQSDAEKKFKSPSVEKETSLIEIASEKNIDSNHHKIEQDEKHKSDIDLRPRSPSLEKVTIEKEPSPENTIVSDDDKGKDGEFKEQAEQKSKSPSIEKEVCRKGSYPNYKEEKSDIHVQHEEIRSKSPSVEKDVSRKESSPEKSIASDDDKIGLNEQAKSDVELDSKSPSLEKELRTKESSPEKSIVYEDGSERKDEGLQSDAENKSKSLSVEKESSLMEPSSERTIDSDYDKIERDEKHKSDIDVRPRSPSLEKYTSQKELSPEKLIVSDDGKEKDGEFKYDAEQKSKSPSIEKEVCKEGSSPEKPLDSINDREEDSGVHLKSKELRSKSPSVEKDVSRKESSPEKSIASDDDKIGLTEQAKSDAELRSQSPSLEKDLRTKESSLEKPIVFDNDKQRKDEELQSDAEHKSKSPSVEKETSLMEIASEKNIDSDHDKIEPDEKHGSDVDLRPRSPSLEKDTSQKEPSPEKTIVSDYDKGKDGEFKEQAEQISKSPSIEKEVCRKGSYPEKSSDSDNYKEEKSDIHVKNEEIRSKSPSVEKDVSRKESSPEKSIASDDDKIGLNEQAKSDVEVGSKSSSLEKELRTKESSPAMSIVFDNDKQRKDEELQSDVDHKSKSPSVEKEISLIEIASEKNIDSDHDKMELDEKHRSDVDLRPRSPSLEKDTSQKEPSPEKTIVSDDDKGKDGEFKGGAQQKSKSPSIEKEVCTKGSYSEKTSDNDNNKEEKDDIYVKNEELRSKSPSVEKDASRKESSPEKLIAYNDDKIALTEQAKSDIELGSKSPSLERELITKESSPEKPIVVDNDKERKDQELQSDAENKSKSPSMEKESSLIESSSEKTIESDNDKVDRDEKPQTNVNLRPRSPSLEKDTSQKEPSPDKSIVSDDSKGKYGEFKVEAEQKSKSPSIEKEVCRKGSDPETSSDSDNNKEEKGDIHVKNEELRSKSPSMEKDVSRKESSPEKSIASDDEKVGLTEQVKSDVELDSKSSSLEKELRTKESSSEKPIVFDDGNERKDEELQSDAENKSKSPSVKKETSLIEPSSEKTIDSDYDKIERDEKHKNDIDLRPRSPSLEKDTSQKEPSPEKLIVSHDDKGIDGQFKDDAEQKSKSPSIEKEVCRKGLYPEKSSDFGNNKKEEGDIHAKNEELRSKSPSVEKDASRKESSPEKSITSDDDKVGLTEELKSDEEQRSKSPSFEKELSKKEPSPEKSAFFIGKAGSTETPLRDEEVRSKSSSMEREVSRKEISPEKSTISDDYMKEAGKELKNGADKKSKSSSEGEEIAYLEPSHLKSAEFDGGIKSGSMSEKIGTDLLLNETLERKTSVSSIESQSEDKGKDRSRSHSLFDSGDRTPLTRSRAASLYDDKLSEKLTIHEYSKDTLIHSNDVLEENDELHSSKESLQELHIDNLRKESVDKGTITVETKQLIENLLLSEYINKKIIITQNNVQEMSINYKIDQNTIIKIINEMVSNMKIERDSIIDFNENTSEETAQQILEDEKKLTEYINNEFVSKKKKISLETVNKIAASKSVSPQLVVVVIENIIISKNLRRESVVEFDFSESDNITQTQSEEETFHSKSATVIGKESLQHNIDSLKSVGPIADLENFISISDRPEPHIDEEIIISECKRSEVESLLIEDYINRGLKINENTLEEIVIKTTLPKYIITEIIDEIVIKKHLSRDAIADKLIFDDDDYEDAQMKSEDEGKAEALDRKSSGVSTPEMRGYDSRLEKNIPYADYESPFHKAFMGGMTEIRTTHITTLSGKSTPDIGPRDGTPDSTSEVTSTITTTITSVPEKIKEANDSSSSEASPFKLGESYQQSHAEDTSRILKETRTIKTISEENQQDKIEKLIKEVGSGTKTEILKHEIIEGTESALTNKLDVHYSNDNVQESTETITIKTTKTIIDVKELDPKLLMDPGTTDQMFQTSKLPEKVQQTADVNMQTIKKYSESTINNDTFTSGLSSSTSNVEEKLISLDSISSDVPKTSVSNIFNQANTFLMDLDKSIPDNNQDIQKQNTFSSKDLMDHTITDQLEQSVFPLIRDLIIEEKSYSGKSSPDISLSKDNIYSESPAKSTPELSMPPLIRDGSLMQSHLSGRSTPDKRTDSRSRTATPEGFRSGDVIRTIVTTTRTMSEEGDIITTTREVTETTNEKGETFILNEKTDVKVDDKLPESLISDVRPLEKVRTSSQSSDAAEKEIDPTSSRSDLSRGQRAAVQVWGSSEERHTYSDEEQSSTPLSASPYFTDSQLSKEKTPKAPTEFTSTTMSSSFYGELPTELDHFSSSIPASTISEQEEFSFKKFTVEKEYAGDYTEKGSKKYIDEADLDFEKALTAFKDEEISQENPALEQGHFSQELSKSGEGRSPEVESKKDPLAGWGSPLGLPSPRAPRKFNLRSPIQTCSSADLSPDSLNFDVINDWGEPMRLPSPAPATNEISNKGSPGTPKKERKQAKKVLSENIKNKKRSESPNKNEKRIKDSKNKVQPVYVDLTYVSHHGNSFYTALEFFKKVRARYYVFSGTEPSREVYDALLEAKKTWEDKDLEVTMIPTYDTDTLGYWVADNEEALAAHHIDLSPSASRCTINLQDHETSCSAYRLEF